MTKVFLVGAGSGDIGLLTKKAMECLAMADVVVYDRLADPKILQFVKDGAEKIYVGKQSAQHTMKQHDINELLAEKALANGGQCVVRLKGGDPFVFGRGGEEALLLHEKNIPFEIVPGVTSAIAAPAYAGIPVTHRAIATSFAVVTGHEDPTKNSSQMNWEKLATATDTIIFLMGMSNLKSIAENLIRYGRSETTPVAIVRWGTHPEQETLITNLKNAFDDAQAKKILPPAVIVVGEVVRLREKLSWFETKPLFGKKILITRTRKQSSELLEQFANLGASCLEFPTIKIQPPQDNFEKIDQAIQNLKNYDYVLFTSQNAAENFFERLHANKKDARALANAKIISVGKGTEKIVNRYGIFSDALPETAQAEGLIKFFEQENLSNQTKILFPRAKEAREILPETLRKKYGVQIDVAPVYETVPTFEENSHAPEVEELREELSSGKISCAVFASSSSVKNLVKTLGSEKFLQQTKIFAIGAITAKTCEDLNLKISGIASEPTIPALVDIVQKNL